MGKKPSVGDSPRGVGPRVALWLRTQYPHDRAKLVARQFRVSPTQAQHWLDGTAPTTQHLEAMFAHWGRTFLDAVFIEASHQNDVAFRELVAARSILLRQLDANRNPLDAARELRCLNPRWRWIWAAELRPRVEYAARRQDWSRQMRATVANVPELLDTLLATVPSPTIWDRLLRLFC